MAERRGRKEVPPNPEKMKSPAALQLGETIRAWRHERLLSIKALADLAGLEAGGRAYISKLEHGRIERIGPERLRQLARALNISPGEIERGERPNTSHGQLAQAHETARRLAIEGAVSGVLEERMDDLLAAALRTMALRFRAEARRVIDESASRILAEARQEQEVELFQHILRQAGHGRPLLRTIGAGGGEQRIEGTEACMRAAIQLIESAPEVEPSHEHEILITWRGERSLIASTADPLLRQEWVSVLRLALDRGWHIRHLVAMGENQQKALLVVLNILALLGARGRYSPLLLDPQRAPVLYSASRDYICVPEKGVIELRGLERAIYYPPGEHEREMRAAAYAMAEGTQPIFEVFPRTSPQFSDALADTEDQPGDRYLVMEGLSESVVPMEVHRARAARLIAHGGDAALVEHILANRERRDRAIEARLREYRCRDLCTEHAILDLVGKGITSPDDAFLALGADPLTTDERLRVLRSLVERMRHFEHYELILLPDALANLCRTYYLAKADYAVLLEFWQPAANQSGATRGTLQRTRRREQVDILIKEPNIVRAFYENPLWQPFSIHSPERRERTIAFLERQIARLEG